jgi:hypothetical protein
VVFEGRADAVIVGKAVIVDNGLDEVRCEVRQPRRCARVLSIS